MSSRVLRGRVKARRAAVQALYQWQLSDQDPRAILGEFVAEREMLHVDQDYFSTLACEVPARIAELDEALVGVIDRPVKELGPVEHAVLLIGVYELKYRPEVPWRVVINEAVELTKMFGAEQAYKYVNGVLDKVAHRLRAAEIGGMRRHDIGV
ncbi:MAG: transcription antitermination factor NusB [Gammaproteobacteria bacterium]